MVQRLKKGFTLIELVVVIAIVGILSTVILFSVAQYINKGKDSNIKGNLAVLISAGEVHYNGHGSYLEFCSSSVVDNAYDQIPKPNVEMDCGTGLCCFVNSYGDMWAACAQLFTDNTKAYCVDSRGVQGEIANSGCNIAGSVAQDFQCP
jgi:prepilin-type N-terminal cleavage/methylation domain-containing protein